MTLINKVKWVLGILVVFLLIVATNLIDRQNFSKVKNSVSVIYEDRLVAKGFLFDLSLLIHEKRIAHLVDDSAFFERRNEVVNNNIEQLISSFQETELTDAEAKKLADLQKDLAELQQHELSVSMQELIVDKEKINAQLVKVEKNLYDLSKIQLEEGRKQVLISQKAMDTVDLFTDIEIYFLILLAIGIQVIVIYKPK